MLNELQSKDAYDLWHMQHAVNSEADEIWHKKIKSFSDPEKDFKEKIVLEIGCGRGGFACWLVSQPFTPREMVAADYSTTALAKGKDFAGSLGLKNITWIEADIQAIPFPDNYFDTVISCETIEHVPNPPLAVKELVRVLKPGGKLFLTTPNYLNLFGIYRIYRWLIGRPFQEAGQPINQFVILPRTLRWVKNAGANIQKYGSDEILIPRYKRHPMHISISGKWKFITKWLGIQSFVFAQKKFH